MKPESLTKEKNIIFYKPITCKHYREEGKIGWCEKRGFTGKAKHFWMFCADCKEWEQKDVKLVSIEKVKQRVQWLLKEIEKWIGLADKEETSCYNEHEYEEAKFWEGYAQALLDFKQKIKKAFSE